MGFPLLIYLGCVRLSESLDLVCDAHHIFWFFFGEAIVVCCLGCTLVIVTLGKPHGKVVLIVVRPTLAAVMSFAAARPRSVNHVRLGSVASMTNRHADEWLVSHRLSSSRSGQHIELAMISQEVAALRDFDPAYVGSGSCVTSTAGPNGVA